MSKLARTQYSIGSPTRVCAATGVPLPTDARYVAALALEPGSEDLLRLDFAEHAWAAGARPPAPLVLLGLWRGVVPEPGAKRKLLIDDESLLELFQNSEGFDVGEAAAEPADRLAFRFVLSLILLRKRLLVQEGSRGSAMLVRPRGVPKPPEGPELIEVVDPALDAGMIAKVIQQLRSVLSEDVGTPVPSAKAGGL